MSSDSSYNDSAAQAVVIQLIVAKFNEESIANCCAVAATALLLYDYLLTLRREIQFIWTRRFTGASVLFLINRYTTVLCRIIDSLVILPWQSMVPERADLICSGVIRSTEGLLIITQLTISTILSLRTYAIWDKNRIIFTVLLILGCVSPICNLIYDINYEAGSLPPPFAGCGGIVNQSLTWLDVSELIAIADTVQVVSNAVIMILTWIRTIGIKRNNNRKPEDTGTSIATLLLRDGTIFFVLLLAFSAVNLVAIRWTIGSSIQSIGDVMISILVSRFMLSLRSVQAWRDDEETTGPIMEFSKGLNTEDGFLGNLGASVDSGFELSEAQAESDGNGYEEAPYSFPEDSFSISEKQGDKFHAEIADSRFRY